MSSPDRGRKWFPPKCSTKLCPDDYIVPEYNHAHQQTCLFFLFFLAFPVFLTVALKQTKAKQRLRRWEREGPQIEGEATHLRMKPPLCWPERLSQVQRRLVFRFNLIFFWWCRGGTGAGRCCRRLSRPHFDVRHGGKLLIQTLFLGCVCVCVCNAIYWGICQSRRNPQWKTPGCVIGHHWHTNGCKTDECWLSFGNSQKSTETRAEVEDNSYRAEGQLKNSTFLALTVARLARPDCRRGSAEMRREELNINLVMLRVTATFRDTCGKTGRQRCQASAPEEKKTKQKKHTTVSGMSASVETTCIKWKS